MTRLNAKQVLENITKAIEELKEASKKASWELDYERYSRRGYTRKATTSFKIDAIFEELSIFDWFNEGLSLSQLEKMRAFVTTAIKLGFKGYVCFKVGAAGCAHGMWAHTEESTDGYSPKEGDVLYHSFRSGDNYFDLEKEGKWLHEKEGKHEFTLKEIKEALNK